MIATTITAVTCHSIMNSPQVPPILPVYIGVVDLTGGAPFLELVKDSLKAVIDGLSDGE